jgi:hypothetical protein
VPINSDAAFVGTPRIRAQINGQPVTSIVHADLINAGSCKSSRFELTVSTLRDTSANQWLDLLTEKVTVEILMRSQPDGNDVSIFEGLADSVAFDPINGIARVQGRDFSSILVNSTHQYSFCNQTASEIVSYVAQRHGFIPNVTATSTMRGSYQCDGYNQILLNAHSRATSEWDLLTHLARTSGFELFVDGTVLVFAPLSSLPRNHVAVDRNQVKSLRFRKILPLTYQTSLTVKSWNSWLGQVSLYSDAQSTDQAIADVTSLSNEPGTEIAIIEPNLTPWGAEQLAQRHLLAINEQQRTVEIVMPGEFSLRPFDVLSVSGGGPDFDEDYIIRSVRRHYSATAGFVQYIQGFVRSPPSSESMAV